MIRQALVIGYGSIGARHVRVLSELGLQVAVVSGHAVELPGVSVFRDLVQAFASLSPDYVVIANETVRHRTTLDALAAVGFAGPILVEKPAVATIEQTAPLTANHVRVAYNLRFHPVLQVLAAELQNENVISVQAYAGQFLPNWRPGTDYRDSYSANRALGGGVLRDLSHEIDYLSWLFGPWARLSAIGGKRSQLQIDSDDAWCIMLETVKGSMITLQLNYLDRVARREITVVGAQRSYRADLVAGRLVVDDVATDFPVERDATYLEQHKAVIGGRWDQLCSWDDGVAIMKTIDNIERAAAQQTWIYQ